MHTHFARWVSFFSVNNMALCEELNEVRIHDAKIAKELWSVTQMKHMCTQNTSAQTPMCRKDKRPLALLFSFELVFNWKGEKSYLISVLCSILETKTHSAFITASVHPYSSSYLSDCTYLYSYPHTHTHIDGQVFSVAHNECHASYLAHCITTLSSPHLSRSLWNTHRLFELKECDCQPMKRKFKWTNEREMTWEILLPHIKAYEMYLVQAVGSPDSK